MRVGIIGFGFMGRMHFGCSAQMPDVKIAAVCDTNPDITKSVHEQIGNVEGLPAHFDMSGVQFYTDLDTMLEQEKLDAVSITLPTYLHADITCKALRAGVHVLCEKPMALNVQQCQKMIEASEQSEKHLMIGHCIRFWPEYADTREIILSERYGKALAANFQRLSVRPTWSSDNWLMDSRRSGGMMLDLHIHDADYIQTLFGMPSGVHSRGVASNGTIGHVRTDYLYDVDMLVSAEAGWLASDSFGFRMNYEIILENATIVYDCTRDPAYQIYPEDGKPFSPPLSEKDGYYHEIKYFSNWVRGKIENDMITMQQSLETVQLIEAEKASLDTGKMITLNP